MEKIKGNHKDNSNRKYVGGGPRPDNNEIKRREAKERNEAWQKLAPQQQLDSLNNRFGKNLGASRQRQKLALLIEKDNANKKETVDRQVQAVNDATNVDHAKRAKDRRTNEREKRPSKSSK